jgi:hypothetical protein
MDSTDPHYREVEVDERWFAQWVSFGMLDMAIYLTKQAAFSRYCDGLNGDRSTPPPASS